MQAEAPRALGYLFSRGGDRNETASREIAVKAVRLYHHHRWQCSPRRLLADAVPLDRPIFLLGLPGSGATLIGRCLRRNRRVVTTSGNSDYWTGTDELGIVRRRMRRLPPALRGNWSRRDIEHPLFGAWHLFGCDELLPNYRGRASDATPDDAARFRRLLREQI